MRRAAEPKKHPLSIQLPEAEMTIIDRAAKLRGRSRTDFARGPGCADGNGAHPDERGRLQDFMAALSEPAKPAPEMVELFRRASPLRTTRGLNRKRGLSIAMKTHLSQSAHISGHSAPA
jgi:uncharacterized protein (DUF1778 family)